MTVIEAMIKHAGACLFFLCACSSHSHWTADQVHSDKKEFSSTKLSYLSSDSIHGIDIELLKIAERLNVYLNVHSIPVPPHQGNQKSALLKLEIEGEPLRCEAFRFEGGQRFLLPEEMTHVLIEALKNHKDVTLILHGYRSTIKTEDFSEKFKQFLNPSPLQNPFVPPI